MTFKQVGKESIREMWQNIQAVLQQCLYDRMTDKALLECFYQDLGHENRNIAYKLYVGGILHNPYENVAKLLDFMLARKTKRKNSGMHKLHSWMLYPTESRSWKYKPCIKESISTN